MCIKIPNLNWVNMYSCEVCGQNRQFEQRQLHLVSHFKEKIMADLFIDLSVKQNVYKCPFRECHYQSSDNLKIITHYGVYHNIVDMHLKEYLKTNKTYVKTNKTYGLDRISTHNLNTDEFQFDFEDHKEKCPVCEKVFETRHGLGNLQ